MKTLYLPLRKEWYDMIERGEKKEEYREITPYWVARLFEWSYEIDCLQQVEEPVTMAEARCIIDNGWSAFEGVLHIKMFDAVCFSYGYTKRRMTFKIESISIGQGRPEWGAPNHNTFIIKLGERV